MTEPSSPPEEPPAYFNELAEAHEYPADYYQSGNIESDKSDTDFNHEVAARFSQNIATPEEKSAANEALIFQLTNELNQEQLAAVTAPDEHLLVLAGAGSGKTRVLTHRVAWLLAKGRATPKQILAVTFTNKAAKEMAGRLKELSVRQIYAMWMGTFHGLCHRFLRTHYEAAGLAKTFQVMDTSEQLSVVRQVMEAKNISVEDYPPREMLGWINACKENGNRANSIKGRDSKIQSDIYQGYENYCNKENGVDFAEMLLRVKETLTRNEKLRNHYHNQFRYLLVDEFQDTNSIQYELLKLFCGIDAYIFAVGDDDQSIYGFRGAKIENIRHFEKNFAKGKVVRLEQSYRSTGTILNAANELIAKNFGRMGKTLWTSKSAGEQIEVFPAYNDEEEAQWMMSEIRKLADQGTPWSDIAILYRINAHSRSFEQTAIRSGIPYRIFGGFRFYDRVEIRHALAYLRLIANPDDASSFIRVVNVPPRGIGEKSIDGLRQIAEAKNCSLMSAIEYSEGRTAAALFAFARLIAEIQKKIHNLDLSDVIGQVIKDSGLEAFYQKQRDGKERLENLGELQSAATQYEQERQRRILDGELDNDEAFINEPSPTQKATATPPPATLIAHIEAGENKELTPPLGQESLVRFLSDAILDSAEPQSSDKSAINMMSVHAAKGLEFTAVFIGGLEHGTFPHENNSDIEEERRLMYVALTRAKQYLKLSFTHQRLLHGRIRQNIPSLFLAEIPKNFIHMIRPISAALTPTDGARGYKQGLESANYVGKAKSADVGSSIPRDFQKTLASLGVNKGITNNFATRITSNEPPFALGQNVHHPKFGAGVVYQYEGAGNDLRILVSFGTLGQKWLLLSMAKLSTKD